jgi:mercuric ion transport protein
MNDRRLIGLGAIGMAVAALCCATPALVVALGAVGLSGLVAWLDPLLLPAILIFGGLLAYGVYRHHHRAALAGSRSKTGLSP